MPCGRKLRFWRRGSGISGWHGKVCGQFPSVLFVASLESNIAPRGSMGKYLLTCRPAQTRAFSPSSMRNFILLSQILPMSLTACLFIIQLHLASPDIQLSESKGQSSTPATTRRKPIASLHLPNILLNASLLALPTLRSHSVFIPIVFLERLILVLPHTDLISLRASDVDKSTMVSAGFIVASQAMARKSGGQLGVEVKALLESGNAVKALGWDAVLGMGIWGCLAWGGGV